MRDITIDLVWTKLQIFVTALGGFLGWYLGGNDGLLITLVVFACIDYITGVMCAISDRTLSSAVGFRGIFPSSSKLDDVVNYIRANVS